MEAMLISELRRQRILAIVVMTLVAAYIGLSLYQNAAIDPVLVAKAMRAVEALDTITGQGKLIVTEATFWADMEQYLKLLRTEGRKAAEVQAAADFLYNQELTEEFMLANVTAYRLLDYRAAHRTKEIQTGGERKLEHLVFALTAHALTWQARQAGDHPVPYAMAPAGGATAARVQAETIIRSKTSEQLTADYATLRADFAQLTAARPAQG